VRAWGADDGLPRASCVADGRRSAELLGAAHSVAPFDCRPSHYPRPQSSQAPGSWSLQCRWKPLLHPPPPSNPTRFEPILKAAAAAGFALDIATSAALAASLDGAVGGWARWLGELVGGGREGWLGGALGRWCALSPFLDLRPLPPRRPPPPAPSPHHHPQVRASDPYFNKLVRILTTRCMSQVRCDRGAVGPLPCMLVSSCPRSCSGQSPQRIGGPRAPGHPARPFPTHQVPNTATHHTHLLGWPPHDFPPPRPSLSLSSSCPPQAQYIGSGEHSAPEYRHYGLAAPLYTHFTSPIRRCERGLAVLAVGWSRCARRVPRAYRIGVLRTAPLAQHTASMS
jgi:hypothetical protein